MLLSPLKLHPDAHHLSLAGIWFLIIIPQRKWKENRISRGHIGYAKTCIHHRETAASIHSCSFPLSHSHAKVHLSAIQSVRFKLNGGSIQMVWYPAWLLFLPIRYAMSTISTRPARAAPTMMGMSIWSWSIWHSSAGDIGEQERGAEKVRV